MDTQAGAVVRIVVRARSRDGERLAIVEINDGRLGITQNDKVLQTLRFAPDDIEGCVREFIRRTGIADHDAEPR
jgi:hypothetical protein